MEFDSAICFRRLASALVQAELVVFADAALQMIVCAPCDGLTVRALCSSSETGQRVSRCRSLSSCQEELQAAKRSVLF